MNSNCFNLLNLRNFEEQVKKAFCYQILFWPFTVWINCSSDLKNFASSGPSASNFKSFSRSLEHFFHTVGQNNFGNKIPFIFTSFSIFLFNCYAQFSLLKYLRQGENTKLYGGFLWITSVYSGFELHFRLSILSKNLFMSSLGWYFWT